MPWLTKFVHTHDNSFKPDDLRQEAIPYLSDHKLNVISYEGFIGDPFNNQYRSKTVLNRIKATFPEAQIFITVRNQADYLLSMYSEYLKAGGNYNLPELIQGPFKIDRHRHEAFYLDHLKFDKLIREYVRAFGVNKILILPFEAFIWDRFIFCEHISSFADISSYIPDNNDLRAQNRGLQCLGTISLARFLNKFWASELHPYNLCPTKHGRWFLIKTYDKILRRLTLGKAATFKEHEIRNALIEYYAESNERLRKLPKTCHWRDFSIKAYDKMF